MAVIDFQDNETPQKKGDIFARIRNSKAFERFLNFFHRNQNEEEYVPPVVPDVELPDLTQPENTAQQEDYGTYINNSVGLRQRLKDTITQNLPPSLTVTDKAESVLQGNPLWKKTQDAFTELSILLGNSPQKETVEPNEPQNAIDAKNELEKSIIDKISARINQYLKEVNEKIEKQDYDDVFPDLFTLSSRIGTNGLESDLNNYSPDILKQLKLTEIAYRENYEKFYVTYKSLSEAINDPQVDYENAKKAEIKDNCQEVLDRYLRMSGMEEREAEEIKKRSSQDVEDRKKEIISKLLRKKGPDSPMPSPTPEPINSSASEPEENKLKKQLQDLIDTNKRLCQEILRQYQSYREYLKNTTAIVNAQKLNEFNFNNQKKRMDLIELNENEIAKIKQKLQTLDPNYTSQKVFIFFLGKNDLGKSLKINFARETVTDEWKDDLYDCNNEIYLEIQSLINVLKETNGDKNLISMAEQHLQELYPGVLPLLQASKDYQKRVSELTAAKKSQIASMIVNSSSPEMPSPTPESTQPSLGETSSNDSSPSNQNVNHPVPGAAPSSTSLPSQPLPSNHVNRPSTPAPTNVQYPQDLVEKYMIHLKNINEAKGKQAGYMKSLELLINPSSRDLDIQMVASQFAMIVPNLSQLDLEISGNEIELSKIRMECIPLHIYLPDQEDIKSQLNEISKIDNNIKIDDLISICDRICVLAESELRNSTPQNEQVDLLNSLIKNANYLANRMILSKYEHDNSVNIKQVLIDRNNKRQKLRDEMVAQKKQGINDSNNVVIEGNLKKIKINPKSTPQINKGTNTIIKNGNQVVVKILKDKIKIKLAESLADKLKELQVKITLLSEKQNGKIREYTLPKGETTLDIEASDIEDIKAGITSTNSDPTKIKIDLINDQNNITESYTGTFNERKRSMHK